MKKGQYFIISAIFIIIAVILIKGMFGFFEIAKERRFFEGTFLEENLDNIENEYEYLAGVVSMQSSPKTSGIGLLWNFTNFTRESTDSKILYVFVFSNSSEPKYYVTVGNFLKDRITARINVTNSTTLGSSLGIMNDKKNTTYEFTPSISGEINITLTYNTRTEEVTEKIPITTASDTMYVFFDVTLESRNVMVRTKEIYNRTL